VKLFVSIDLEGCTGVFDLTQTRSSGPGYATARALQRSDLMAVIDGCRQAGATGIVVCDAHGRGANLDCDALGADVELVAGSSGPLGMMCGIDESFDAALMVGYHAMAGTRAAVLDHTFAHYVFRIRVDDALEAGELGLNAALAGAFGVPVVFASGDDKLALEARELLPEIRTVVVKEGLARSGARLMQPHVTAGRLTTTVSEAMAAALAAGERPRPLAWDERPLRVVFTRSDYADAAAMCPGAERVDARSVRIDAPRYLDAYRCLLACLRLAGGVTP